MVAISICVLVWTILSHFERRANERIARRLEVRLDRLVGAEDIARLEKRTGDRATSLEGGFGARMASFESKMEGRFDRLARVDEIVRLEGKIDGLASNLAKGIDGVLVVVSRGSKDGDQPDWPTPGGGEGPRKLPREDGTAG